MEKYIGEIAALGTSFCWAFGSVFFTIAARLIGPNEVNRIRLVLGMIFLMFAHFLLFGTLIPMNAYFHHWFWFGISGLIGFTIGDTFLFRGYVLIGPRLTMLLMSLSPIFGTILAWVFLNETLTFVEFFGIIITVAGVSLVVYDKREIDQKNKDFLVGIMYGLSASLCQALGYFASKKGLLYYDFPPLSGNLIRIMSGSIFIWIIALLQGQAFKTVSHLSNKKAVFAMFGGAICGPFIGVWLSLIAIQNTYIGIASTLMALPPVILIPLSHWIFNERVTYIAIIGTLIAVFGVALIFLR